MDEQAANLETEAKPISVREATARLKEVMQGPKKPQAEQPKKPAAQEANSEPEAKEVPETEPSAGPEVDVEQTETKAEPADATESTDSDEVELADSPQGLAEQLGVTVEQLTEHIKVPVKINGQETQVNLKELAAGYQREADYRNKTAKLADENRQVAERARRLDSERQYYEQSLIPMIQQLHLAVSEEERAIQGLADTDPSEYVRRRAHLERRQAELNRVFQEQQGIAQRQNAERQAQREEAMRANERKLLETYPEWRDVDKGRKGINELREYAKAQGIPAQDADSFFQAEFFTILKKAKAFDEFQKSKPETMKKVVTVPKYQKPGAEKRSDPKTTALRVATDRLRKTGKVKDAGFALGLVLKRKGIL